jgi:hypothetical protein
MSAAAASLFLFGLNFLLHLRFCFPAQFLLEILRPGARDPVPDSSAAAGRTSHFTVLLEIFRSRHSCFALPARFCFLGLHISFFVCDVPPLKNAG